MSSGGIRKAKTPGVWQCLERLQGENNPRLVAIIEREDAQRLLAMRKALTELVATGVTKRKVAAARRLLAHR